MPIEVRDLRALEGPNLYYGQSAVKLQLWSDRDLRQELGQAIKTWAQMTGMVIGYLQHDIAADGDGYLVTTTFTTPLATVGERMVEAVVADLQAAERADEEYSHDDLLFDVIRHRKREEPSLPLLQIFAEARARDLPFLPREDGKIMVGSGSRGHVFDAAGLGVGLEVTIPWDKVDRIPVLAITGTNGKTTTARLCAHVLQRAGYRVGRTDTDGIVINGEQVDQGDWAGFGGARRVLTDPLVDIAVLETSRGGILRRGLGFDQCDVSVITNVSSDHLGEFDVDTLDELARVKGVIALATRADGRVVLNADDSHVSALQQYLSAAVVWFTRHPEQDRIRMHLQQGGDVAWSDGSAIQLRYGGQEARFDLADLPITVGGLALHNVENVLAATAACAALGIPFADIGAGLRSFSTRAEDNFGRSNLFQANDITVILDYAHNEAGLGALIGLGRQICARSDGRLIVLLGGPGDRPEARIVAQGRIAGSADLLLLHDHPRYRRGRSAGETPALYRAGAIEAGLASDKILDFADETGALDHALAIAQPGDVIAAAAHAQREELIARLRDWEAGADRNRLV
jgi:cyanophycin synthetase